MFIRCKECHSAVWVEPSEAENGLAVANCRVCGQEYKVGGASGRAGQELATATRRLADEQQIDLPGAYSVKLKIMDIDGLKDASRAPAQSSSAVATAVAEPPHKEFDPAFQPSVDAGLMSAAEAARRGIRDVYAKSIMERFDLPVDAAHSVADNRISLLEALRRRGPSRSAPMQIDAPRRSPMRFAWVVLALALVAVAAAVQKGMSSRSTPAGSLVQQVGDTVVHRDESGRMYQVRGPDPLSVLRTFCAAGDRARQVVAAVPSDIPGSGVQLGLLRDPVTPADLLAIDIREDSENDWVAGEPGKPLIAKLAPAAIAAAYFNHSAGSDGSGDNPAAGDQGARKRR